MKCPMRHPFLVTLLSLLIAAPLALTATPPRLAVVISVDQMRGDYLDRFSPWLGEDGFRRLLRDGTLFTDAHLRHSVTLTAPGHAALLTGVYAETHGVIANSWMDRATGLVINSVEDGDSLLVGIPADPADPFLGAKAGRSPRNLQATTVGDQLKLRYGHRSRVVSLSNKDRAAILMGGKLADGAFWFERGQAVSSVYYGARLPAWVEAFNARGLVDAAFGATWDRVIEAEHYDRVQGEDDAPGEASDLGMGTTFPRTITGGRRAVGNPFYSAFDRTPFASDVLTVLAREAIIHERLGQRGEAPDLLALGYSQIDVVGHSYGTDSHEMMDSILRLDRNLAELFAFLDAQVGEGNWVAVLTADHGAGPLPERVQAISPAIPSGRFTGAEIDRAVMIALEHAFGAVVKEERWFVHNNSYLHLNREAIARAGRDPAAVAAVIRDALLTQDLVLAAYTRDEIRQLPTEGDSMEAYVRRSHHELVSGDIVYVARPYFVRRRIGTNHGSPHHYDTHVPVIWYGPGIPHAVRPERIGVDDIAPTLSVLLGVPAPPQAKGRLLFPNP